MIRGEKMWVSVNAAPRVLLVQSPEENAAAARGGGMAAFLPYNEKERAPAGSFLWTVEPRGAVDQARSLWSEFINTDETERMGIPQLRIKTGLRWAFRVGHSRLIHKAASRIADVLSNRDERAIAFAD